MYALIENNTFVRWIDLRKDFPYTSFPIPVTQNDLPNNVVIVDTPMPPLTTLLQVAVQQNAPVFENNQWTLLYSVQDLDELSAAEVVAEQAQIVRDERNRRLNETDWTQVFDAPVDCVIWAAYRQLLRDVTLQSGFPFDIQWPTVPLSGM